MGEDGTEGRNDPCVAGEGAAESDREGANKTDKRSPSAAEGSIEDVGKGFTGMAIAGARGEGGGEGVADPGSGDREFIVG